VICAVAENSVLAESSATFDNVTGTMKKLVVLIRGSTELSEDSDGALGTWFATEMGRAFAQGEDEAAIKGDGTSTFAGIRGLAKLIVDGNHGGGKVTAAGGHNTYATLDSVDIGALVAALPARALPGAGFCVSRTGFGSTFCRLAAAAGGWTNVNVNGRNVPGYLGFPVFVTPTLPTSTTSVTGQTMILFGDMYQSTMLTSRRDLTIGVSAQRYFDSDQVLFPPRHYQPRRRGCFCRRRDGWIGGSFPTLTGLP
jgi:HK97 family phage major capsid protein